MARPLAKRLSQWMIRLASRTQLVVVRAVKPYLFFFAYLSAVRPGSVFQCQLVFNVLGHFCLICHHNRPFIRSPSSSPDVEKFVALLFCLVAHEACVHGHGHVSCVCSESSRTHGRRHRHRDSFTCSFMRVCLRGKLYTTTPHTHTSWCKSRLGFNTKPDLTLPWCM